MDRFPALELTPASARVPLRLRPLREGDVSGVLAACRDPVTRRWLELPQPYTEDHAREYVMGSDAFRLSGAGIRWAIADAASDQLVGAISLKETDWRAGSTDVGYWAVPAARGQGYVTAATRAACRWAFAFGVRRVTLRAIPENVASNRVAVAAGFRFVRRLPGAALSAFGREDLNLYELTAPDPSVPAD